ncbi:hypothetical protein GCM10010174_69110 [Kutzneria viridogrisea]|uniref:Polyketide-type polyunsaturated fatty acid synthase PfaA n=1 Tax=Kutzneria viridogrisea TaxID=47990 RepID=A0ABR6BB55_9PSEU|nr:polyketide-type polyunsaturated fatty acid synthase PfaA [Kutzneria viridogrisea]
MDHHDTAIAIVGLGALYPKAGDLGEFWANVVQARDCIEEVPESHWRVEDHYDPDPAAPDKTYCKRGGFLPEVPFDPLEFGLPPNTLDVTDVLQLLSLVVAKQTLADAGSYDPARTGVVLGVTGANSLTQPLATRLQTPVLKEVVRSCGLSERDAEAIAAKFVSAFAPWEENSFPGMLGNVVAGRIANRFDLGGTNCTVDAACASSLAAVHVAAAELLSGRADLMLTGGCDAENTILMYLCFSKTPAFSRAGVIRPFDESSDGTLIGEGIGMLALKRLADAERDEDRIYAVLRGIGSSSDGRYKSIYAPRKEGQVLALRRAYQHAGFGPEQIGLVECHGTGTSVGDLTELTALREVYGAASSQRQFAAVGSVKSQIGHTKAAAGAASMIKLALALHHRVLPPTINVRRPRAAVDFATSPFYVNTIARPWITDPMRPTRRAALSSFGFGGTNFHCVLEEHDESATAGHPVSRVHVWSAPTPQQLIEVLASGVDGSGPEWPVPAEHARLAVVAGDQSELDAARAEALQRLRAEPGAESFELASAYYRRVAMVRDGWAGKVGALFAGQGSQYVGMGTGTALALPPVRAAFDRASAAFGGPESLGRVVFPPPAFDEATRAEQDAALRRTEFAQPAIGALAVGQYRYLGDSGFVPDGVLGHSFGELVALWAAESLTEEEFTALARARGAAMARRPEDQADPGTMAAVRLGASQVEELLAGRADVFVCNVNSLDQVVVGGGTQAVREFVAQCRASGVGAQELPVAAAFHTKYVAHAVQGFGQAVSEVEVREPKIAVYSNLADGRYGSDVEANRGLLVRQLGEPVQFAARVQDMYADGFRVFVEFGPRGVLSGLVRRILADRPEVVVLTADGGPGTDGDRALKQVAARLLVLGLPLSGLNRHAAPAPPRKAKHTKGMRIALNGVNHVSDDRRRAYRQALDNGYRIEGTAPAAHSAAAEHLAMHRDYLDNQLRIAERLSGVLEREAAQGPREGVLSGINSIVQHSVAIGQTHVHATEVLRSVAQLDTGTRPAPITYQYAVPAAPVAARPALPEAGPQPLVPDPSPRPVPTPPPPPKPAVAQAPTVRAALLEVVSEKTGYPTDMLDPAMDVEADLGIDSIKRVEIMGVLRERFPGTASAGPEKLAELRTLDDIVTFLAEGEVAAGPKA